MSEEFDPYRKWLGIPPKDQPPNHYRLLGIATFEDDPDVIENSASRQMAHVRTFQSGRYGAQSQRILNELTGAKLCLLQPEKKAVYDVKLREKLQAEGKLSSEAPLEAAVEETEALAPPPPEDFRGTEGRWRTSSDGNTAQPPMVKPVPIPMPPMTAPIITTAPRRTVSPATRGRKPKSSGAPMVLIFACVGLLVVGGGIVALMAMQKPASAPNHSKAKPAEQDKEKPDNRPTQFPLGSNARPEKQAGFRPKPEMVSNRPAGTVPKPAVEEVKGDPQAELVAARQALVTRDDDKYQFHINQAHYLNANTPAANAAELTAEEEHLREVHKQLDHFWHAVREGTDKKIPKGEVFKFRKHELELVKREGDRLIYKLDGKEDTAPLRKLPARVASMIAYRTFGNDRHEGKIAMALFLLVDSETSKDPGSQRLKTRLVEELKKAGEENNATLNRELEKAPKVEGNGDEDLSPPITIKEGKAEKSDEPKGGDSKDGDSKPKKSAALDADAQKQAREKFNSAYREKLLAAQENPAKVKPLLEELVAEVKTAETNEQKVILLSQAGELAAKLGDSNQIVKLSREACELSGENPLEIQLRQFGRCSYDDLKMARDLINNCLAGISRAQEENNLYLAFEFFKTGKRAADKHPTAVDLPMLIAKLQELEKAKAQRK